MANITDTPELKEYAASIAASTIEMLRVTRAVRDALTDALDEERHYAAAIQGAEQTEDRLIHGAYGIALTPFMQPTEYEEETEDSSEKEEEAEDTGRTRAGRTPQTT